MSRITPVMMGATAAALAVAAQAFLLVQSPPAYGLCIVCHGRDLIIWVVAHLTGAKLIVADVSLVWPLLTVVGIFFGSRYAAISSNEFNEQWVEPPVKAFLCGMGVMMLGLVIMACPARLLLRAAYGDFIGAAGAVAVLAGAVIATFIMRWRIRGC